MIVNSISSVMQKRCSNNSKVAFTGHRYADKTDGEVRRMLVTKYLGSSKLDSYLKTQITDELLLEKFQWETPTVRKSQNTNSIYRPNELNKLLDKLKDASDKAAADSLANGVLAIISYLTGKEIEKSNNNNQM